VRNYQARNFMRDAMQVGDGVLFYHSGCAEPGIAGIARVASGLPGRHPVRSGEQVLRPKSTPEHPRWLHVDVASCARPGWWVCPNCAAPELENMRVLARGNRLSITPVEPAEWRFIVGQLLGATDLQDWT
jgi:predicted RNA-binding protein with PUA-like domain